VAGTSGQVYPVAGLPGLAAESGGAVVDVNPEPTPISELARVHLRGASGVVLPRLAEALGA
jgi:NAD-dependent deacetylase